MYDHAKQNRDVAVSKSAWKHQRNVRDCDFKPGDRVWMLDSAPQKGSNQKLRARWKGPYTVIDKTNAVDVLLKPDGPKKKSFVSHMSRLKRCFGKPFPKFEEQAKSRKKRRGRPRVEAAESNVALPKSNSESSLSQGEISSVKSSDNNEPPLIQVKPTTRNLIQIMQDLEIIVEDQKSPNLQLNRIIYRSRSQISKTMSI